MHIVTSNNIWAGTMLDQHKDNFFSSIWFVTQCGPLDRIFILLQFINLLHGIRFFHESTLHSRNVTIIGSALNHIQTHRTSALTKHFPVSIFHPIFLRIVWLWISYLLPISLLFGSNTIMLMLTVMNYLTGTR